MIDGVILMNDLTKIALDNIGGVNVTGNEIKEHHILSLQDIEKCIKKQADIMWM